jgi:dienelactone hydrolase
MATKFEYAALAAEIYNDQRGGGSNLLVIPADWSKLSALNGFLAQNQYDANIFSFTAGAYVNSATGEIVVSYKGTDFLIEKSARAWNTLGDLVVDVAAGIGQAISTMQFGQAATYYQEVKKWARANGYDPEKISFTGHSLGGGIASVMSEGPPGVRSCFNISSITVPSAE